MIAIFLTIDCATDNCQKGRDVEAGVVGFDGYGVKKFSTSVKHVFL